MNVDELIKRECPRYVKKYVWNGTKQAIINTHSRPETRVKYFDIDDESIDIEVDKMNQDYENYLRDYYSKERI